VRKPKGFDRKKSFPKFVREVINPCWQTVGNCDFDAQDGLMEMGWQLQRFKLRTVKNSSEPHLGPKTAADEEEIKRRKAVAEKAKVQYELLKSTELIMNAINWRVADIKVTAAEQALSGIAMNGLRAEQERDRKRKTIVKCIRRLALMVKPYSPKEPEPSIGLLPTGKKNSKRAAVRIILS
jgi:hypothetical protein